MRNAFVGMFLAGTLVSPAALGAQQPPAPPRQPREPEVLRLEHNHDRLMQIVLNRRARLGVKVNLRARETDSIGAYVDAVTPGGPAADAGLRSGDVITKLAGKSVLAGGAAEDVDHRQSLPGLRLIELAARLEPNDTVPVEFRRGKDRRTVSVVTEDDPDVLVEGPGARPFALRFWRSGDPMVDRGPLPSGDFVERLDLPPLHREFFSGSPLGRLELAPINPELGRYFGAEEGVLVISAPKDSALGLRGGDVVLAVDGRKPAGPAHLLRILRSYESGETFKLDILRNRKRETVSARLGEREG
ncbi:MAG: PDZ domain-containing protein [Gemmatimonadales bacterium]|nr:PDZ domain-containing protein [Gemmatimonadales bacterium]MBA3553952.1 PDZ domain-containing protein [Gemmatimonadales bacterium]